MTTDTAPGLAAADLARAATLISDAFTAAGVMGHLHAVDLSDHREIGVGPDETVVPASVFKVPVLLELCRQDAAGEIDASAAVTLPRERRTPSPFGLAVMQDPASLSLRDLAWLMIGISDNAATDVVCAHVGLSAVAATLASLGLDRTVIGGDCLDLFRSMAADAGVDRPEALESVTWEQLAGVGALDPQRSLQQTTPRDCTRLLQLVWDDAAAPAAACAEVRRVLGLQVWPHRLASGFPEDAFRTSGKTGTLPSLRNEIGVVEHQDGGRYAVAVFTRSASFSVKNPAADAVIGQAARIAVDAFRGA